MWESRCRKALEDLRWPIKKLQLGVVAHSFNANTLRGRGGQGQPGLLSEFRANQECFARFVIHHE